MKYTNQEDHARCFALLAQHTYLSRFEDDTKGVRSLINEKKKTVKPQKGLERFLNFYVPSKSRILITRNITFNMDDAIPVFTDIAGETLENLTIPKTLTFNYTDVNIINQVTERELARAVSMSQEKQNTIRCECSSSDPFVPCYENKQCSCYKMNVQMRCLQVEKEGYEPTEFATFKPSYFSHVRNKFYNYIGFACSDSCSCAGKCTNNSMMFIDNKTFPLEVIRTDKDYGFNVVSPVLIPAGTPVIEFVGEVVSEVNLNAENVDYSYKVSYSDDEKWRLLIADAPLSDDYKQVIYDLSYHNFYIDPKKHGNIGRMIGHACIPNLEVVRIFRKSLSPAHVSLVFVALEDIFPGTILSFDYGPAFAKTLKSYCQCGTFACRNNQKSDEYSKLSCADIALAIKDIHEIKHEMFEDRVMRPIRK
uniref:SET domain-containing protein n=1 Tax=Caenorhabditis tropicalis TaxID=1561998 RepID=A0A1I7TDT3_9PELO